MKRAFYLKNTSVHTHERTENQEAKDNSVDLDTTQARKISWRYQNYITSVKAIYKDRDDEREKNDEPPVAEQKTDEIEQDQPNVEWATSIRHALQKKCRKII